MITLTLPSRFSAHVEAGSSPGFVAGFRLIHLDPFTLSEGGSVSEHVHATMELGLVTHGHMTLRVGDRQYELTPGSLRVIRPGEVHSQGAIGGAGWTEIIINLDEVRPDSWNRAIVESRTHLIDSCPEICDAIRTAMSESKSGRAGAVVATHSALLKALILLTRHLSEAVVETPVCSDYGMIHEARMYINFQFHYGLTVAEVARGVGVSPSHLAHTFRRTMGIPVRAYIGQILMERAARLVEDGSMSVTQIAETLGFPSVQYFSSTFKRHFGVPPTAYHHA